VVIDFKNRGMKKFYILLLMLFNVNVVMTQVQELSDDSILLDNANRTLKAATSMSAISFVYQATGAMLILTGAGENVTEMGFGLALGIGGVGMATNNAILTDRAYNQIKKLRFAQEDSLLRMKMLKNIKSARALSIIQNLTPILGVTAGAINYSISKPNNEDKFFTSNTFWIPVISICAIGLVLTLPEVIFIEKTLHDLDTYRRKLTLGTTKYGIGVGYKF
jgi:hypothetical protein